MTIQWGAWEYSGGNGMRVGVEVTTSAVVTGSSTVTFTFKVYTQNQYSYSDSQVLTFGGTCGSGTASYTNGSGSGAIVLRSTETCVYTYTTYGSSPGTRTFSATLSGAYNGVTPAVSVTVTIPARPYAAPNAPTGVSATRTSDTGATVNWTNSTTAQKPYTSLTVQKREWTGNAWGAWVTVGSPAGSATSLAVTGLSANHAYQFQVRSNNTIGSSAYVASGTIYMTPSAPSVVTAALAPAGTSITITWDDQAYTSGTITWTIERSVAGGAYAALTSGIAQGTLTYSDASPGVGTNAYRVKAVQSVGALSSAWTVSNTVSTIAAPLAPTLLSPNGSPVDLFYAGAVLTWQHNHGGDGAAQSHYTIEVSSDGGTTWTAYTATNVASTVSSHTIPTGTLANGVTYQWRVKTEGIVSAGFGPTATPATIIASATPTVTITSPGATTSVLPLAATWTYNQEQSSAQALWEAELIDSYGALVEQATGTTETSVSFGTKVADGSTYTIRVRAKSAAGLWSTWTSVNTTIDLLPPAAVTTVATYDECSGTVSLEMTPVDPTPGASVTVDTVDIERQIDNGAWVLIGNNVPVPMTIIDTIPSVTGTNAYRITSISSLPSYYVNDVVIVQGTNEDPMWAFLSYGDGFGTVLRLRGSLATSATAQRARAARNFMGRRFPTLLVGEEVGRAVAVRGTAYYDDRCGTRPHCDYDSPRDDWETAALEAEVVCYRDHTGRRMFGMLGDVSTTDTYPGVADIGFSITETEYDELPGVSPTAATEYFDPAWMTSTTNWGALGFGYQYGPSTVAVVPSGIQIGWVQPPSVAGNGAQIVARIIGAADGLVAGRTYRALMRVVIAPGSPPVRAEIGYIAAGTTASVTGVPVDIWVDFVFSGSDVLVGPWASPNPNGSVIVQSISVREKVV